MENQVVDNKTLVKHDGCFDCGATDEQTLTSVMTTRLTGKKQEPKTGSYALCSRCLKKEGL